MDERRDHRRPPTPAGRHDEFQLCRRWLGEAAGGRPRVVLVEGEAGVGKTTLARAVLEMAHRRDAAVGSSAFQPYDIAHRAVLDALRAVLGPDGLSDAALAATAAEDRSPEQLMAEVFGGTGRTLVERARSDTVVLALDDAHWADAPSLDLLGLLLAAVAQGATAGPVRLLVVLTGRPGTEPGGGAGRLAALRRFPGARALTLQPPSEVALGTILAVHRGRRLTPRLLRTLHEVTGGLPLHAELLLEDAVARDLVVVTGDDLDQGPGFRDDVVGRTIEDVVTDCIDELGDADLELLLTAACLGTAGPTSLLEAALPEEWARPPTPGTAGRSLLTVDDSGFHFRHPQVHHVVLRAETRRARTGRHCRIAERLAAGLPPRPGAAAIVDRQLRLGHDAADPDLVYRTARSVADTCLSTAAWSDAGRAYERAIRAADHLALTERELAELRLRAGSAAAHDHDTATAVEHFTAAIDLARRQGDTETWGRAALGMGRAMLTSGQGHVLRRTPLEALRTFVDHIGPDRSELAARGEELMAEIAFSAGDYGEGFERTARARRLAGDDAGVLAVVDFAEGLQFMGALQLDRAEELFRSSYTQATSAGDLWESLWGLTRCALIDVLRGEVTRAAAAAVAAAGATAIAGSWAEHTIALGCAAWVANLRGDFAEAETTAMEAAEFVQRSDYAFGPLMVFPQLAWARAVRGDWAGADEALEQWASLGARGTALAGLALRAALAPDDVPAGSIREPAGPVTINSVFVLAAAAEMSRHVGDRTGTARMAGRLTAAGAGGLRCTPVVGLLVDRYAAFADEHAPAEQVADGLAAAAGLAADLGLAVEAARCTVGRAEVLRELDPDRSAALTESALAEFHRMDALSLAVRAERLLDRTGHRSIGSVLSSPLSRTILFTDIVDSTRRNAELGDATFLEVLRSHDELVRARLRDFSGTEFKHTGDGLAVWFRTADDAAAYCLAVQDDLEVLARAEPEFGIRVRMGLAEGIPLEKEGDLFGLAVVRAARVCALAGAGQVLVADEVAGRLDRDRFDTIVVGDVELKGLPNAVRVHRLRAPVTA